MQHRGLKIIRRVPGSIWAVIVLMIIFISIQPAFISSTNILNILRNASILLIVSIGMTMVIVSGQINISVGGIVTLSGVLSALYIQQYTEPTVAQLAVTFLVGMGSGLLFGILEGIMIGLYHYNFWLVTFACMSMANGLAKVASDGGIIAGFSDRFRWLGTGKVFGVSMCIILAAIVCALMILYFNNSKYGMHVYAIGNSERAAINSGINVGKARLKIYSWCGFLSGLAAVLLIARTNSAGATIGTGYEFNAIATVVIGGTSMEGGRGGISGTVFGALFIAALKNGLQVIGLNNYWQQACLGLVIIVIIVYDVVTANIKAKNGLRRIYDAA